MGPFSRRRLLAASGGVVAALAGCVGPAPAIVTPTAAPPRLTVKRWVEQRRAPYYIGHRGAAGVCPEHSMEGYLRAIEWGVPALEISTCLSLDGALYCMHDLRLDRTTTLHGEIAETPASIIDTARLRVPRLGPAWQGDGMPAIPRLVDVVQRVAGRAVLCIEAKVGRAVEPMIDVLKTFGVMDTVIFKAPVGSPHIERARDLGLPVFAYLGSPEELTEGNISRARAVLRDPRDALVVPTRLSGSLIPPRLVGKLKDAAPSLWVYATHRRSEVAYYEALGVEGFVASNVGYQTGAAPVTSSDTWASGRLPSGLLTNDPYSESQGVGWELPGAIQVGLAGMPTYVTLADLTPVAGRDAYRLDISFMFTEALGPPSAGLDIRLCVADDSNPATDVATTGYVVRLNDGAFSIAGATAPEQPIAQLEGEPPTLGTWSSLAISIDPEKIGVDVGGLTLSARDRRWRGGYVHIGRRGSGGRIAFRDARTS